MRLIKLHEKKIAMAANALIMANAINFSSLANFLAAIANVSCSNL